MQIGVPQSCVEPTFVFQFTCAQQQSLPLLAAPWLECMPCLRVARISTQRSPPSPRLSLWHPAVQEEQQCIGIATPAWTGISVVYRNFREALDGNRRKQTETDGNRRKHTESRGIRFGASLVVVSWPSSLPRRVVSGKNRPKIKIK